MSQHDEWNCEYCDAEFDTEAALHQHWLDAHEDEITSHEKDTAKRSVKKQRQQQQSKKAQKKQTYRTAGIIAVVLLAVVGGLFALQQTNIVTFTADGDSGPSTADSMSEPWTAHYHTQFALVVNGERIDFSQPQYQHQAPRVHFEGNVGNTLHLHATGVPLRYLFDTLGWEFSESSATIQGQTFNESQGAAITTTVNGEEIENAPEYVPREGDNIRIEVSN